MTTIPSTPLTQLLVAKYEVEQGDLRPDATLDELGLDSLAITELIDDIQAEFGVAMFDDGLNKSMTVAEVMRIVEAKP